MRGYAAGTHTTLRWTPERGRLILAWSLMGRPSKYPPEFRREPAELVKSSDRPRVEIAKSLGISDSTLANWMYAERDKEQRDADPDALSKSEPEELARLRQENIDLRTGREILRKAAACFARETTR